MSKYFVIPFDKLPEKPDYTVWYATWTTECPAEVPPGAQPMVVGITTGDQLLPDGAVLLASYDKDPLPPPPPDLLDYGDSALSAYQQSFELYLSRDEDEQPSGQRRRVRQRRQRVGTPTRPVPPRARRIRIKK